MKEYCLKIQSKNEKSLKNFLHFFFKHLKTKFNIIQKSSTIKTNRNVITFLKSPHVNKTAQVHFESHLFTKKILVTGSSLEKTLIFFKKILTRLFQDISIHLEFLTNEEKNKKNNISLFSPNSVKFLRKRTLKKNLKRSKHIMVLKSSIDKKNHLAHLTKFLNIISIFGEMSIISFLKHSLFKS